MHIPISRSYGITLASVAPSGGLVSGRSGLIRLVVWTPEEMIVKSPLLMLIQFPGGGQLPIKTAGEQEQPQKIKFVFYGVTEGWKIAKELKESGIPVVPGSMYEMPSKWEDGYDAIYRKPSSPPDKFQPINKHLRNKTRINPLMCCPEFEDDSACESHGWSGRRPDIHQLITGWECLSRKIGCFSGGGNTRRTGPPAQKEI